MVSVRRGQVLFIPRSCTVAVFGEPLGSLDAKSKQEICYQMAARVCEVHQHATLLVSADKVSVKIVLNNKALC